MSKRVHLVNQRIRVLIATAALKALSGNKGMI